MQILLRKSRVKDGSVIEQNDVEFSNDQLLIGSDAACDVQLFGEGISARHWNLFPESGSWILQPLDGSPRRSLSPGDRLPLGSHTLSWLDLPQGFDAAVEILIDDAARPPPGQRFAEDLKPKLPSTRHWSYLLALLVAALGLGIPMLGYHNPVVDQALKAAHLPSDALWLSGPLSSPHHLPALVDNCKACHSEPFQQVGNQACVACHSQTPAHFAPGHPTVTGGDDCTTCHKEHNQPETLVVKHSATCIDCHTDRIERRLLDPGLVTSIQGATDSPHSPAFVSPATAFTSGEHPGFMAALLRLESQHWQVQRLTLTDSRAMEQSNLKFPHDQHMGGDKVRLFDDQLGAKRDLECADCHRLQPDGQHFSPITMEANCESCHSLSFDDTMPNRRLPHGDTEALLIFLEEFYLAEAVRAQNADRGDLPRWVPKFDMKARCDSLTPMQCGKLLAAQEVDLLFNTAGCVDCHEVHQLDNTWRVLPVRLAKDWFSAAHFDHRPHLIDAEAGSDASSSEVCLGCHEAEKSTDAADILMPDIGTCLACHDESGTNVVLQCGDCHSFHLPGLPAIGTNAGGQP